MSQVSRATARLHPSLLLVFLVFTLASALGVNPYSYARGDNSITIPFVKSFVDPALYPGDYLIAQRPFYYTYLWNGIGLLHAKLGIDLAALFFGIYLVALYLTFLAIYRIALDLFDSHEVAILALLFVLFSKETLAAVNTIEHELNTRAVVAPLLLFGLHDFLRRRTVRAFLWLGLAYLIHPLTTHYMLAMLVVAGLVELRRRGLRQLLVGLGVFAVVASPLLAWRARHTPPSFHLFSADPEWLLALHERSAHHMFPSDWGWKALVHALVILAVLAIAWRHRNREREERHRVILIASITILALCAFGVIGADLHPIGMTFLIQPVRAFQFMEYFAIAYVAHDFYRRMSEPPRFVSVLSAAALAGGVVSGALRHVLPYIVVAAVTILMAARQRLSRHKLSVAALVGATTCLAALAAVGGYVVDRSEVRRTVTVQGNLITPWVEIENWARTHTDIRDGFIVPPEEGGEQEFRVFGERTVYADEEDGGLMNANPAFGKEWHRRMTMLGYADTSGQSPSFCRLEVERIQAIAREMAATSHRVFIVWPCTERALPWREWYRNEGYVVYEVK